jgi:hypothetical protein
MFKKKKKGAADVEAVGENDMADNPLHEGGDDVEEEGGDTENPLHEGNDEEDEEL